MLTAAEIGELASTINEHLAGRGYTFATYAAGTWLLRCEDIIDCESRDPAAAAGCNIHDYMPSGPDGARMRSLMNELQMVLHEHPVNEQRERRREPMVNAVWLWGFGAPVNRGATEFKGPLLASDDPWLRGLWQLNGAETVEWTCSAQTIERTPSWPLPNAAGDCIVAVAQPPAVDTADALAIIERQLLEPIRSELKAGKVGTVAVLTGARVVVVDSTARFKFWRGAGDLARWLE